MLKNADKTTNLQKPPVYKHTLPRVLETSVNYKLNNDYDKNTTIKFPLSPPPLSKQTTRFPEYNVLSNTAKERQSRVDRILEKYRRQPSDSVSRQFSRSLSCNTTNESTSLTEPNLLHITQKIKEENKSSLETRSVSPYALVDSSELTSTASISTHRENKANAMENSRLLKSYSLKSLGDYRARTLGNMPLVEDKVALKNNGTFVNNDEDPPSSSSSSTTTTSNSAVPKDDNNHFYCYPSLMDWAIGNCSEETVSDRIRRRSFYVKLK